MRNKKQINLIRFKFNLFNFYIILINLPNIEFFIQNENIFL